MKTSVIVTTYNRIEYLRKVLESLCLQSRMPDEVIVADDGSGPETGEYVRSMAEDAPFRLAHVWHEDIGFRAAKIRNEAVKESRGEYLIFLDGDCLVNRHFVSDHMRLSESGYFVQGKRVLVGRGLSPEIRPDGLGRLWPMLGHALAGRITNSHHLLRLPLFPAIKRVSHRGIKTCNMGVYRQDVLSVNGFNERFEGWGREDSEFAVRLYKYGLKRIDHPFMAICYHLWHMENDRDALEGNDRMLQDAMETEGFRCHDGILKD